MAKVLDARVGDHAVVGSGNVVLFSGETATVSFDNLEYLFSYTLGPTTPYPAYRSRNPIHCTFSLPETQSTDLLSGTMSKSELGLASDSDFGSASPTTAGIASSPRCGNCTTHSQHRHSTRYFRQSRDDRRGPERSDTSRRRSAPSIANLRDAPRSNNPACNLGL